MDTVVCIKQVPNTTRVKTNAETGQLAISQLTYCSRIVSLKPETGSITVERLLEEGREIVEARLPVLLTVVKDINQPRLPSLPGIRRAARAAVTTWGAEDLPGADPANLGLSGSPTRVAKICSPPKREGAVEWISGTTPDQVAAELVDKLLAEKVI